MTSANASVITKIFYISTGRKNGFYTLRTQNQSTGLVQSGVAYPDNHVCTLTANEETASVKAHQYVEAFKTRVPESEHFKVILLPGIEHEVCQRRGSLSVHDTLMLEELERGVMPFGKHKGKVIEELPANSILWYADQTAKEWPPVMSAVCDVCAGIAVEKGYFTKRDEDRTKAMEQYGLSQYVGLVKARLDFSGTLIKIVQKGDYFIGTYHVPPYFIHNFLCGNDIIVYKGAKKLCENGESIHFRATVKCHEEWNGAKTTVVNRPKVD